MLNDILDKLNLSKREIMGFISANSSTNENFVDRLLSSLKRNKRWRSNISRKLGKHCKRESTENPKKKTKRN